MSSQSTETSMQVFRFILLTDIVGSSRLAEHYPEEYMSALELHNQLIEKTVEANGGSVYKNTGDGYLALFDTAGSCLDSSVELATAFGQMEPLTADETLQVRVALHAGELQPSGAEYFGPALNRVSRICQVCNPGQILCSSAVATALGQKVTGLVLHDLGSHHLRDLAEPEQLYHVDSQDFSIHEFPPLATLDNRPNNLVEQPNEFVGRSHELAELSELLTGKTKLLSIIAPGGYGKSRCSAQLCANLLHRFEHGVFMVYLAPLRDSSLVTTAIASALHIQFSGNSEPEDQLMNFLREKELLLCLDNFEHVMDSGPLVRKFLNQAPKLRILITSREALRIKGEQVFSLQPLVVDSDSNEFTEAELLFAERVQLVKHGFVLQEHNHLQIREICKKLSGIPLAIELAAAWMDNFTLAELNMELSQQLELESRESDAEVRHRSLKASMDWSWNLMGEEQQIMLMQLSTFRGGFYNEAASELLGISGMKLRSSLARLLDKSWLYSREAGGRTRYYLRDMLALQYAFEKLVQTSSNTQPDEVSLYEQSVLAHARYFSGLMEREGPRLEGDGTSNGQLEALATIRRELENIEEAWDTMLNWLEGVTADDMLPLVRWLVKYLAITSSFRLLNQRCEQITSLTKDSPEHSVLLLQSLLGSGYSRMRMGDIDSARTVLEQASKLAVSTGNQRGQFEAASYLGSIQLDLGNLEEGQKMIISSQAIASEIGDSWGIAGTVNVLALKEYLEGNIDQATKYGKQCLEIRRERCDNFGIAGSLNNQGLFEHKRGNHTDARKLYLEAMEINLAIGNRAWAAYNLGNLGDMARTEGDLAGSIDFHTKAMAIERELGIRHGMIFQTVFLGEILTHCKQLKSGAVCLFGARQLADQFNFSLTPDEAARLEQGMAEIEHPVSGLPADERERLKAQAIAMSLQELAQFAVEELETLKDVQTLSES